MQDHPTPAPQAPPPRPRRRWWRYLAWGVPVTVLVIGGLGLGLYLFVLSQISVGTGEIAARRQRTEAFGWPLRLNDRVNVLLMGVDVTLDNRRRVLNVAQAAGYIRFRHDALGDIGRVERQHKLLTSLVRQLRDPSTVVAAPKLLRVVAENTQTSLTPSEMMTLGFFALRIKDEPLRMHTLPGTFAPEYWEPTTPKVQALVADLFYGVGPED